MPPPNSDNERHEYKKYTVILQKKVYLQVHGRNKTGHKDVTKDIPFQSTATHACTKQHTMFIPNNMYRFVRDALVEYLIRRKESSAI